MAKSRPAPGSAQRSPWSKPTVWGSAVLVVAIAAGGGAAFGMRGDDDGTKPAAQATSTPGQVWRDEILRDTAGAGQGTLDYLKVVYDWIGGKTDAANVGTAADRAFTNYMEALDFLSKRTAFGPAPLALANFRDAFQLYTETARLAKLGAGVSDAELRTQIQRQILRLKTLADRVYDLAKSDLEPFTNDGVKSTESFQFTPPEQVPSFAGSEIAPGAPLTFPGSTAPVERAYQPTRPEQDFAAWADAVAKAGIPAPKAEVDAIAKTDLEELGRLAVALTEASNRLYDTPDPKAGRNVSTRIQLGLLVQSEAMRTAQIAALLGKDERPVAVRIAETLALVGNGFWDSRLPERSTDLPQRLLERTPA
ncbi:MAG: hypothetical protein ACT4QF_06435 [Sporichthyaceae bacterium]